MAPVDRFDGGTPPAKACLAELLRNKLGTYIEDRKQLQTETVSHLAMYLNFGHTSPVQVARAINASEAPAEQRDAFLEELIVRPKKIPCY